METQLCVYVYESLPYTTYGNTRQTQDHNLENTDLWVSG